jgi:hypothetical protein
MIEAHARGEGAIERVMLGLHWSLCELAESTGLCFSPSDVPRTLSWPGTLCGRSAQSLAAWLRSFDPAEASLALCAANALINQPHNGLLARAQPLHGDAAAHLRVFAHFLPAVRGAKVAVVGRYPGLDALWAEQPFDCIERKSFPGTLPDTAAEYALPRADWVFVTGSAIANKTAPRLLELAKHATVVLMGPSVPWLDTWGDFGVDYVAGVAVKDREQLYRVAAEGGGTRVFETAVEYRLAAL